MRSRLPNLSLKQGTEGGHIFQKGKENFLLIFVSEEDHLGLQIRRNEQVLRCQGQQVYLSICLFRFIIDLKFYWIKRIL